MTSKEIAEAKLYFRYWEKLYPVLVDYRIRALGGDDFCFQRAVSTINSEANALLLRVIAAEAAASIRKASTEVS